MKVLSVIVVLVILNVTIFVVRSVASYRGLQSLRYANPYCESAGNIHAISWGGTYRGKWQFDRSTWHVYAPPGWKSSDPAWAPEWVQDRAALNVPYDAWPNC